MSEEDEKEIVSLVLKGDSNAYASLVIRYQKAIFNLMLRMQHNRDTASDLTQETFIRAYEKLDKFNSDNPFFPWLYAIGLNIARDHGRKQNKIPFQTENTLNEDNSGFWAQSGDYSENTGQRLDINHGLAQLPEETREALVLRFKEEFSYQEIAQALNITLSGAKMKVHRGLKRLEEFFSRS